MTKLLPIALAVFSTSLASRARAEESLEERSYWKAEMRDANSELAKASADCGVELTFEFLDKAALRAKAEKERFLPHVLCNYIIKEVGSQCRDGAKRKAAVAAKVKAIECTWGERSVTVKKGVVRMKGKFAPGFTGWLREQLIAKL